MYRPGQSFAHFLHLKESVKVFNSTHVLRPFNLHVGQLMMRGSSLLLESDGGQLFCRVFLDETLSHFCWEDDDLRSTALPLEFVVDIVVMEGIENAGDDSDDNLPVFALILNNEQVLKVTCPNSSEFKLWFEGLQRLLAPPLASNEDDDAADGAPPPPAATAGALLVNPRSSSACTLTKVDA